MAKMADIQQTISNKKISKHLTGESNIELEKETVIDIFATKVRREIIDIPIGDLIPFENQAREDFRGLEPMIESIREVGIAQPLTVVQDEKNIGKYQIVSGERRWRASKYLKLKVVPCNVIDKKNAEKIAIIENLQRKDLNIIEKGKAFILFLEEGYLKKDLYKIFPDSRATIDNAVSLYMAPIWFKDAIIEHAIFDHTILSNLLKYRDDKEGFDAKVQQYIDINKKITGSKKVARRSILRIDWDLLEKKVVARSLPIQKIQKSTDINGFKKMVDFLQNTLDSYKKYVNDIENHHINK